MFIAILQNYNKFKYKKFKIKVILSVKNSITDNKSKLMKLANKKNSNLNIFHH